MEILGLILVIFCLALMVFSGLLILSGTVSSAINSLADAIKGLPGWKEYKVPDKEWVDKHADLSNHLPKG
jgi:hypothetical protein